MKNEQKTITNANEVRQNKPNVPTLRFKQYDDKWTICNLSDIASVVGGGTPDTTDPLLWNGNVQWFTPTEVGHSKYVSKSVRTISRLGLQKSSAKVLPKGSILLSSRATVGECSIVKNECTTNQGFQSLIPRKGINNEFLYYLTQTKKKHFIKYASGSTFLEISNSEIKKTKCAVPCIDEQTKIAEFLSLLDEKIETQNKIISKYESLIKGLVDYLLDRKGLRYSFKDLYVRAGEGGTPATENKDYYAEGTIPFIKIEDLNTKYIINNNDYISELGLKKSSAWMVPDNSIIYSNGATIGSISINKYPVATKQGILGIVPSKLVLTEYLYYYMQTTYFRKQIKRITVRGTMDCAYLKDINSIPCFVPSVCEQQNYIKILFSIDKKINTERIILNKLKEQKRYLLSNLFI